MKKTISKFFLSLLIIGISLLCYVLPPKPYTKSIKVNDNKTIVYQLNTEYKLFDWIGILFLAFALWIWRKELKVTSIGPISGPPLIEQRNAEDISRELKLNQGEVNKEIEVSYDREKVRDKIRLDQTFDLVKEKRAINAITLARDLGIAKSNADLYLNILTKEGKLRQDGFPYKTVYTLADAYENLAINKFKSDIEQKAEIISDRRYVKIKSRYEVDALMKSTDKTFIIEVKLINSILSSELLKNYYYQLMNSAQSLEEKNIEVCLILVTIDSELKTQMSNLINNISFDTYVYPLRVIVYSRKDLKN